MGTDAIADACAAAGYNVCLATEIGDVLVRIEGVVSEHVCADGERFLMGVVK
jgi:hypothetical protein